MTQAIFAVLGFLDEAVGREINPDSPLVERFQAGEKQQSYRFKNYLMSLIAQQRLRTMLRSEEVEGQTYFYSAELAKLINVYYLDHGLVSDPADFRMNADGADPVASQVGKISAAVFPEGDRQAQLSYLIGAYQRYGEQNTFRFTEALHKAHLVQHLLQDLGGTSVVMIYPPPERSPAIYRVAFAPTPELVGCLELRLAGWKSL
jgi:hypothetical protein